MQFPVVIHKEEGTCYGVTVPDLLGCISAGESADDALENVKEAITGHVESMVSSGYPLPEVKSVQEHVEGELAEDYEGGIWAYVDVDLNAATDVAVRISVTIPSRVLARIDRQAKLESKTRSGFLVQAAEARLSG